MSAPTAEKITSLSHPWRVCRTCDVKWRGEPACWNCGVDVTKQLAPWQTAPSTCQECGNDDVCEGYRYCSDCLEVVGT